MNGDLPREVEKPWGSELWYAHTDRYAGKILRVREGHRLSVQYHEQKDETSYLLSGRLLVEQGTTAATLRCRELAPGESWRSTPELHDVVRIEDRYGRAEAAALDTTEQSG
jgi:mannose-6-phosphate isomerase